MSKIYVVKRRAGVEQSIPVKHKCSAFCDGIKCNWNLGGFIETMIIDTGTLTWTEHEDLGEFLDKFGILSLDKDMPKYVRVVLEDD